MQHWLIIEISYGPIWLTSVMSPARNDRPSIITSFTTYYIYYYYSIIDIVANQKIIYSFILPNTHDRYIYQKYLDMTFNCCLCQETFSLRKQLLTHERTKHWNNKIIPHLHLLLQPSFEQLVFYQDAFIILIKKHLGFNRHSVRSKQLSINAFLKMSLFICFKINLLLGINQHYENIVVHLKVRQERKG